MSYITRPSTLNRWRENLMRIYHNLCAGFQRFLSGENGCSSLLLFKFNYTHTLFPQALALAGKQNGRSTCSYAIIPQIH